MRVYKKYVTILLLYALRSYPYGWIILFELRLLYFLIALILGGYAVIMVLALIPSFREFMEKGGYYPFESILIFSALFTLVAGVWFNGYREGLKNGKTENLS